MTQLFQKAAVAAMTLGWVCVLAGCRGEAKDATSGPAKAKPAGANSEVLRRLAAPDAVVAFHFTPAVMHKFLNQAGESVNRKPNLRPMRVPTSMGDMMAGIDAVDIYFRQTGDRPDKWVCIITTRLPVDQAFKTAQRFAPELLAGTELRKGAAGRYSLGANLPVVVIDGSVAGDIGEPVIVVASEESALAGFKGGLSSEMLSLLGKVDPSSDAWAIACLGKGLDDMPLMPRKAAIWMFADGAKKSTAELTFANRGGAEAFRNLLLAPASPLSSLVAVESTQSDAAVSFTVDKAFVNAAVDWVTGSLKAARDLSAKIRSQFVLKDIGVAIRKYGARGDSEFPPDLATLVSEGLLPESALLMPAPANGAAANPAQGQPRQQAYAYLLPAKDADGDTLVAYEPPDLYGDDGGAGLFVDGHVIWLKADKLEAAIAKARQRAQIAPAGRP